jgi:hypothetical protein
MRLPTYLLPVAWTYAAWLAFDPLAAALPTAHPAIVSGSLQALTFALACTAAAALEAYSIRLNAPAREITRRDLMEALQQGRAQERQLAEQARSFAATTTAQGAYKVMVGKRAYHFPAGITPEHLLALAEVIGRGEPPTDRALVPPFTRGDGGTYQVFRDWAIYHAGTVPGELAQFRTRRSDWDFTPLGTMMLYQWCKRMHPPTQTTPEVKKTLISLNKAMRARTSNQK